MIRGQMCVAIALCLSAGLVWGQEFYRYKNSDGRTVLDTKIPGQYVNNGYDVLDSSGRLLERVPPVLLPDASDIEQNALAASSEQSDQILLSSYSTAEEIDAHRLRKVQALEREINIIETDKRVTQIEIDKALQEKADYQARNFEVPVEVLEYIDELNITVVGLEEQLMRLSRVVDAASTAINGFVRWTILIVVFVSAGNAVSRKFFDLSSNAFLEIQWYLFSAVFLLGAGYVFLRNDHVRVDVVSQRLTPKARAWVDLVGIVLFLVPFCAFVVYQSWPIVADAWRSGEVSQNAGGLVRWPVYLVLPLGFVLLLVQSVSEAIKRVAFLKGVIPDPVPLSDPVRHDDVLGP